MGVKAGCRLGTRIGVIAVGEPLQNNRNGAVQGTRRLKSSNSPFNALTFFAESFMSNNVNTAIVVKVTAVGINTVSAIPLVAQTDAQGNALPMTAIPELPFFRYQGGRAAVIVDPVVGDIGLAVFAQQDCSNVQVGTSETQPPASNRSFDMSDGFYFGGFINKEPTCIVRVNDDNTITITASAGVAINGDITVNGNLVANGISLTTHTHGGIEPGSGSTGAPQ